MRKQWDGVKLVLKPRWGLPSFAIRHPVPIWDFGLEASSIILPPVRLTHKGRPPVSVASFSYLGTVDRVRLLGDCGHLVFRFENKMGLIRCINLESNGISYLANLG